MFAAPFTSKPDSHTSSEAAALRIVEFEDPDQEVERVHRFGTRR